MHKNTELTARLKAAPLQNSRINRVFQRPVKSCPSQNHWMRGSESLLFNAMGARAVFLVGFMGSGKSSVGQELALRLGWNFVDLDTRIESREGRSIPEIFRGQGESVFRQLETTTLRELISGLGQSSVVALGGGAFAQQENQELLRTWPTVFLESPVDQLWQRCSRDSAERPMRQNYEQFARLYAERLPSYRKATVTIDTSGRDLSLICAQIAAKLNLLPASDPDQNPATGESS